MAVTGTLTVLRHGQTVYNVAGLLTGHFDAELTEKGMEQGRNAGRLMKGRVFDKAYSSTLSRAFNTAALVLEHSHSNNHLKNADGSWQIERRVEVIEINHGEFTGRNKLTDPEIIAFHHDSGTPVPGGESRRELVARIDAFFKSEIMPRLLKGENVLLVCHAGVVRAFDRVLDYTGITEGTTNKKSPINNAAPTIFTFEDGVLKDVKRISNDVKPPVPGI